MSSQQNSSDLAFGGFWNQSGSQFSASSGHYEEAEDAPRTALSYSFVPPGPLFGDRDAYEKHAKYSTELIIPIGYSFYSHHPTRAKPFLLNIGSRLCTTFSATREHSDRYNL